MMRKLLVGQKVWYISNAMPWLAMGPVFAGVVTRIGWFSVEVTLTKHPDLYGQPIEPMVRVWMWDLDLYLRLRK